MKIPIASIRVDTKDAKRARQAMGDMEELKESMQRCGLIQPIVVSELADDPKYEYLLAAGGRRLLAALYLGWKEIDVVLKRNLNAFQLKEIEYEENARRKDFTWQEKVEATRQLHLLKQQIYGDGDRRRAEGGDAGWIIQDTAAVIGASAGTVSQDIKLAQELAKDPELLKQTAGMPKFQARKFVERMQQKRSIEKQLASKEIVLTSDLLLGRAEELIKDVKDGSVSLLLTDPPFGEDAILDVASGNLSSDFSGVANVGGTKEMDEVYKALIPELSRVMVPGAHFYMFFCIDRREQLIRLFEENGFIVHRVPLVWWKRRTTMMPNPYHYIPCYEFILFGMKAPMKRTLLKPVANCLTEYPAPPPQKRIHSLQKPIELMRMFIENSTVTGELVLDPFTGSGVALKAAKELGRRALGFELDEGNFYAAQKWLRGGGEE